MTQDNYVVMKKTSREKLIRELKEVKKENQQLKNNRDKAIEVINIEKSEMGYAKFDSCLLLIEQALRGDSDE